MNISVLFDTCTIKLKLDKRKPKDTMSMIDVVSFLPTSSYDADIKV